MQTQKGFTLTELMITIGLLLILLAFASLNLVGTIRKPVEAGARDILISDIRSQQIKAMTGKGDDFGIDFNSDSYTLTPDNFTVILPDGFVFTTTPQLTFEKGTGETTGVTVFLQDIQSGQEREIKVNKYGATY
jgi:prepilin-type N-terminal cleavage/methylation domain-containing protein